MTPFAAFILTDALLLTLLVCSMTWVLKTSATPIWLKVTIALALGILVCWTPLATRAILGFPQPRILAELPDRFQLFAEHSIDDKSFDLWIATAEQPDPLAVTIIPDKVLRSVLRQAQRKLSDGVPVFITRDKQQQESGDGKGSALNGEQGGQQNGAGARTSFNDDQDKWVLEFSRLPTKVEEH